MKPLATNWLVVNSRPEEAEILICGFIGADPYDQTGVAETVFLEALAGIPKEIPLTVGINSQGGSVQAGLGIYNALERRGNVTVRVDGYAVSIASVIALAGNKRISPVSSIWMIHEPAMLAFGDERAMEDAKNALAVHGETIADIYASKTKLSKDEAREKMKATTWFKGSVAKELGFATDTNNDSVTLNALDTTKYKDAPKFVTDTILAAAQGNQTANATPDGASPDCPAASLSAGAVVSGGACPAAGNATNKGNTMPEPTAAAQTPPDNNALILDAFKAQTELLKSIKDSLTPPPATPPTSAPVATRPQIAITSEGLNDHLKQKFGEVTDTAGHAKRYSYLIKNWNQLQQSYPVNANTDSASGNLTVAVLADGFITVANNRLAPLSVYTRNFNSGRTGRNKIEFPKVTAGGTAQSNPTSFEDATNFVASVANCEITPAHVVAGGHITNAELQNGWRMDWWVKKKVGELSDKIQALINAVIVTGTYTNTPITAASSAFGSDELKQAWASIKNSAVKSILLDGDYYAQFLPANLESFNPMTGNSYPGWDNFYMNNYWTGATTNTVGFACGPDALLIGAALPVTQPNEGRVLTRNSLTLPDLGISVDICDWFATSGRISWMTFELMFGAIAGDSTQGTLIKSS